MHFSLTHCLVAILSSFGPLTQDYPANDVDWSQAFDAMAGGASAEDAILPAPAPNRLAMAEFRAIWEVVAVTSWSQDVLYHLDWDGVPLPDVEANGLLSDGTAIAFVPSEVLEIVDQDTLNQLSPEMRQLIADREAVGWVLAGVISSSHGDVVVEAYYCEYLDDSEVRKVFFPVMRLGNDFRNGGPMNPALQACLNQAYSDFKKCRRTSGGIFLASLLGAPFTGGKTLVVGGISAMVNQSICAWNWADDTENCLTLHTAGWWVENGRFRWR